MFTFKNIFKAQNRFAENTKVRSEKISRKEIEGHFTMPSSLIVVDGAGLSSGDMPAAVLPKTPGVSGVPIPNGLFQ